jgi:hypothetical protein
MTLGSPLWQLFQGTRRAISPCESKQALLVVLFILYFLTRSFVFTMEKLQLADTTLCITASLAKILLVYSVYQVVTHFNTRIEGKAGKPIKAIADLGVAVSTDWTRWGTSSHISFPDSSQDTRISKPVWSSARETRFRFRPTILR